MFERLKLQFYELINRIDYGSKTGADKLPTPDIRGFIVAKAVAVAAILFYSILYFSKAVIPGQIFILIIINCTLSFTAMSYLYKLNAKRSANFYILCLLSGFFDISLFSYTVFIPNVSAFLVVAIGLIYCLIVALVLSNVLACLALTYSSIIFFIFIFNPFSIKSLYKNLDPQQQSQIIMFGLVSFFLVIISGRFGKKYLSTFLAINKQNQALDKINRNLNEALSLTLDLISAMSVADFHFFLQSNEISPLERLPLRNGQTLYNDDGIFTLNGNDGQTLHCLINKDSKYAPLFQSEFRQLTINQLTEKFKFCQAYEKLSMQANIVQNEKLKIMGLMAAGVAHEINNPLHFMSIRCAILEKTLSYKNITKENFPDPTDYRKIHDSVAAMRKGIERVEKIVSSIRIMSKPHNINYEKTPVADQIESALLILENKIKEKNLQITKTYDPIIKTSVSEHLFGQVFLNLILNAIQASPEGSKINISGQNSNNNIRLEIEDFGHGMDQETQQNIFNPFFTTKLEHGGTGLGMTIARKILIENGGKISIDSKPNQGTKIKLELPC